MTVSPETLAAYADNELGPEERAQVEAALAADPALREPLESHRALTARLRAAYAPVIEQPAPQALIESIQAPPRPQVVDLASARAARQPKAPGAEPPRRLRPWPAWTPLAACLLVGLSIGFFSPFRPSGDGGLIGPGLAAQGPLAQALDNQLAADGGGVVRIGLSFRQTGGGYCRTFEAPRERLAGLACRQGETWRVRVAAATSGARTDGYRTASSMPPAVAGTVEDLIVDLPFDARAERAARDKGWR